MSNLFKSIRKSVSLAPGWSTKRKLLIFESDDWGSQRMPSLRAFNNLERAGVDLRSFDAERFNLNDCIETASDLERLFEVLWKFKDSCGNSSVFTSLSIMANPDFKKIAEHNFNEYFYEPFTETLLKSSGSNNAFDLIKEGISNKIFVPQLHGREHLNVCHWMKALRNNDYQVHLAFKEGVSGFVPRDYPAVDYQAAFLIQDLEELNLHAEIVNDAITLFDRIFGYEPEYFVPPNGVFNNFLNKSLYQGGIKLRSVGMIQNEPIGKGRIRKAFHWSGQKDSSGLRYVIRNSLFEPGIPGKDWIDSCLRDINMAFRLRKPAIINTHRVNYCGTLNPGNRDNGLRQLSELLHGITRNWKDVEFITTPALGKIMNPPD